VHKLQQIISLIDLTSLNADDNESVINNLCEKAKSPIGPVAAVCVYPQFIATARQALAGTDINIATVVNFPEGNQPLAKVVMDTEQALQQGADEIDVVIPYSACLQGDFNAAIELVSACKEKCGNRTLKVIMETSLFTEQALLYHLSMNLLQAGADFLKTSTGKISVGATELAANTVLTAIADYHHLHGVWRGFKASGGIKTQAQAEDYLLIAETRCGAAYLNSKTFRFGASSLVDSLLKSSKSEQEKPFESY
jgi:deoxyribose-phosphate aldolase